jgi:hypothetical protein
MATAISSALRPSLLVAALITLLGSIVQVQGITRYYDFNVRRPCISIYIYIYSTHVSIVLSSL